MYALFRMSMEPLREAGKLAMILVQFPPWFDCTRKNVDEIRFIHQKLTGFEIAIEFRHQSWYSPSFMQQTLEFLRELTSFIPFAMSLKQDRGVSLLFRCPRGATRSCLGSTVEMFTVGGTRQKTLWRGVKCVISIIT